MYIYIIHSTQTQTIIDLDIKDVVTILVVNPVDAKRPADKPLLRRKSDLPADILTQKSLENYQVGFCDMILND